MKLKPTVIRGNASEIMAVAGAAGATTKGVDSTAEAEDALEAGKQLAREAGCVVAITGAVDLVGSPDYGPIAQAPARRLSLPRASSEAS